MDYSYLVTKRIENLPSGPLVMVDGTVRGWAPAAGDLHFDHHRPGGADVQIEEIPDSARLPEGATFVTTMLDADASAAAAWLRLLTLQPTPLVLVAARTRLAAIAWDCDHLGLPAESEHDPWRSFAAHAVAAMKETGRSIPARLGLPERGLQSEAQRTLAQSQDFRENVDWLVDAALGRRAWPGECGEALNYFARQDALRPTVESRCRLYRGCMVFDQRGLQDDYIDARLPVEWARRHDAPQALTLTVREGAGKPDVAAPGWPAHIMLHSYMLGRVPLHAHGSPRYSDRGIWKRLSQAEARQRKVLGIVGPDAHWRGRNDVGGSSSVVMTPEQVLDEVLGGLASQP